MDHEVDSGEMAARESELRAELKLPISLIERVSTPRTRSKSAASPRSRSR
jgi:probable rRNA maturation factor